MFSQHNYLPFSPFLDDIHSDHIYTMETCSNMYEELFFCLAAYDTVLEHRV